MSETSMHPFEAILRLCGQSAPLPWFPRVHAEAAQIAPEALLVPLEFLWLEGLIQKTAGDKVTGPGFTLTEAGQRTLHDPEAMARMRDGSVRPLGDRGGIVRDAIRNPQKPVFSRLLLWANFAVFGFGLYLASSQRATVEAYLAGPMFQAAGPALVPVLQILHQLGALRGDDIVNGEWWRLLSTGFVHIGLLHLFMNMYVLKAAGRQAEAMWGRWRFLVIYLAALVGGSCAMVADSPQVLGAGASGALCGSIASEAVWLFLNRRYLPWALVARWRGGLMTTLVLMVFLSLVPGVSGWAHLGGALAGAAAAFVMHFQRFGTPPLNWVALLGLFPVFGAGFMLIEKERTINPIWHAIERKDFSARVAAPTNQIVGLADQVYEKKIVPQLERHPGRRNPDEVKESLEVLAEQKEKLASLLAILENAGPYRQEELERKRHGIIEGVTAEIALMTLAATYLQKGSEKTPEDENSLGKAVQAVGKAWQKLGQQKDEDH